MALTIYTEVQLWEVKSCFLSPDYANLCLMFRQAKAKFSSITAFSWYKKKLLELQVLLKKTEVAGFEPAASQSQRKGSHVTPSCPARVRISTLPIFNMNELCVHGGSSSGSTSDYRSRGMSLIRSLEEVQHNWFFYMKCLAVQLKAKQA